MWLLAPKHTPESVGRELAEGLERGTISLGRPEIGDDWTAVVEKIGHEVAVKVSGLARADAGFRDILVAAAREAAGKAMEELLEAGSPSDSK